MKRLLCFICFVALVFMVKGAFADDYYVFGTWDWNGPNDFTSVNGIDGYGDYLVVEDGSSFYFKKVTVQDSDNDGLTAGDTNPIEPRVFTDAGSYDFSNDIGQSIFSSAAGAVMTADKLYLGDFYGNIYSWDWTEVNDTIQLSNFATILSFPSTKYFQDIAYDETTNTFYSLSGNRDVYSFNPDSDSDWQWEFNYGSYSGNHGDGIAVASGHVFVSDMTSDVIGQWDFVNGSWVETTKYYYNNADYVEGMGFGPNDHFWITAWNGTFYEIGGGKFDNSINNTVPEPATLVLVGSSLVGVVFLRRKKAS